MTQTFLILTLNSTRIFVKILPRRKKIFSNIAVYDMYSWKNIAVYAKNIVLLIHSDIIRIPRQLTLFPSVWRMVLLNTCRDDAVFRNPKHLKEVVVL